MMTPTEQYKYDSKFRKIVDILRHELMNCEFTPSELRQAVILAATMHADQNIRPIIFGGVGYGCTSGHIDYSKPNFTEQVKEKRIGVADRRTSTNCLNNPRNKWERHYLSIKGDRRQKANHVHKFDKNTHGRDYLSYVYYDSTFDDPKTATGSNL